MEKKYVINFVVLILYFEWVFWVFLELILGIVGFRLLKDILYVFKLLGFNICVKLININYLILWFWNFN